MGKEWVVVVVVLAVVLFFAFKPAFTGQAVEEYSNLDEFAQCTNDAGLIMYGTDWCSHCANQKKMFGKAFKNVNYVNCDFESQTCDAEGVTGYPTWKLDGESYPGVQQLERLASLSGCALE